jgi:2-keto-4-pentenoate hydratase/2-oxohepta-3-ene-1,7-dioic acid hydratase in catechol pathway
MILVRLETESAPVWAARQGDEFFAVKWIDGTPMATDERVNGARLLAPVDPPVILAIGLNYRHHAEETGAEIPKFPVLFVKTPNTLIGPEEPILLPKKLASHKVDFEGELAFVISKKAKNVPKEQAMDYVLGFTIANDVSARDWQKDWGGSQWIKGKSFDNFCPVGPNLVTPDEFDDWRRLSLKTTVSGKLMQDWYTDDLIFDIPTLIEFLSGSTTLLPGTLVLTGTPQGVGVARTPPRFLHAGDIVEVEIEGIGCLRNPVIEETV